ncbi:MAG TPA: cupin domain-containing protein, partial [Fimbriimonadaceae bacterium]|nr:cupin domain-containing protein [Fimbriimonadaceae bacterium]
SWDGVDRETYKDEPGTWMQVSRRVLSIDAGAGFEVRYFEVEPGGYTSFEMHRHEHVVLVLRGKGEVRLHDVWHDLGTHDVVRVSTETPHQFRNAGAEPFGILCVVDKERDRPILLDPNGDPRASEA